MHNNIDLDFGQALQAAMDRKDWTQRVLAAQIPCQRSLISQWINGYRTPNRDHILRMIHLFDDVEFNFAVARWSTGGLVGNVFDGVQGGRAGAAICAQQEISEVLDIIREASPTLLRHPDANDLPEVLHTWLNLKEAHVACAEMMRRLAQEYEIGARELHQAFTERVRSKGYVTRRVA